MREYTTQSAGYRVPLADLIADQRREFEEVAPEAMAALSSVAPGVSDRLTRGLQELFAEDWLRTPIYDQLGWHCARCRFTGPDEDGHAEGCTGEAEAVRIVVTRYFPEED